MKNLTICSLFLVFVLASGGVLRAQATDGADADVPMAPVAIDGVVLFQVRGVSSYPADARAGLIRSRIMSAAVDPTLAVDSITTVDDGTAVRILARNNVIMTVLDADAVLERVSRAELANAHLHRLRQAIAEYRAARSPSALWRSAWRSLVATLVLGLTILLIVWSWRWLDRVMQRRVQARIHTVGIQSFEVVRADQIRAAIQGALTTVRTLLILACVFVYLGFLLALWPWTHGVSHGMIGLALDPLRALGAGFIQNIPRFAFLVVLFFVVRIGLRMIRLFFGAIERRTVALRNFDAEWAQPTYKIVRLAVVALALIVAYPYIPGSGSEAFKGVSLFIGIVFSLGSSSAIANIIAGYMMTYRRAFRVGDRVKIGDAVGEVILARLQVTHIRTPKNEEIVIPNSQILGQEVLNYSSLAATQGLILHTEVGIGYETPWRQVEAMLLMAAARTKGLAAEPPPFVLLKALGDFAVTYELNVGCSEPRAMMQRYSVLHRNVLDVFNEYGVQIMTPAYEGDPEVPKVVSPKDWYAEPAVAPARTGL